MSRIGKYPVEIPQGVQVAVGEAVGLYPARYKVFPADRAQDAVPNPA